MEKGDVLPYNGTLGHGLITSTMSYITTNSTNITLGPSQADVEMLTTVIAIVVPIIFAIIVIVGKIPSIST